MSVYSSLSTSLNRFQPLLSDPVYYAIILVLNLNTILTLILSPEPVPVRNVDTPHALPRPHASASMMQRQGSFRGFSQLNQVRFCRIRGKQNKKQTRIRSHEFAATFCYYLLTRISIRGCVRPAVGPSVRPSVRPYVPCYFRR